MKKKLFLIFSPLRNPRGAGISEGRKIKNKMEGSMPSGIIWIIDAAYLLKASASKIDLISLRRELQEWAGGRFDRCIFFNSTSADERQNQFHQWLEAHGFELKLYGLKESNVLCEHCKRLGKRQVQKGVDVGIATSIIGLSEQYKRLVLTAGDGDLIDAVRFVRKRFREVFVAGFHGSMAGEFRTEVDALRLLNK